MSRLRRQAPQRVLFVTKFSASPVTALGVPTERLMRAFPNAISLYWATPRHLSNRPNRIRMENAVIARAGRLQADQRLAGVARSLGLSWWRGDSLRRSRRHLIERLKRRVSQVYVAPIDVQDARRMRQLVRVLQKPFVLHLWDSFSGPLADDRSLLWLIRHAAQVFVVSDPLAEDVRALGADARTLLFSRAPALRLASAPEPGQPLRIALLGTLDPYADGVVALMDAFETLGAEGLEVEPLFIGSTRAVSQVNRRLRRPLEATGFLTDAKRDEMLASCHLGFVPGPSASPSGDMRSRYSIPSRSLDFLAVGLPALGLLHPASAAGRFYTGLGIDDLVRQTDAADLADAVRRMSDPIRWQSASERAQQTWRALQEIDPAEQLAEAMRGLRQPD